MNSYIEIINNEKVYVAVLNAGKCKAYSSFLKELVASFSLPESASSNFNDITGYICFPSWFDEYKTIKIILSNSGSLKKNANRFDEIITDLNILKNSWQSISPQHKFIVEIL